MSGRKFPTKVEIKRFLSLKKEKKRFLCSRASGFSIVMPLKILHKAFNKDLQMRNSTLDQFILGWKASKITPVKP